MSGTHLYISIRETDEGFNYALINDDDELTEQEALLTAGVADTFDEAREYIIQTFKTL